MIHPCAACSLRFASSGELMDHIRTEHVSPPPLTLPEHGHRHRHLEADDYSREGWARPSKQADT